MRKFLKIFGWMFLGISVILPAVLIGNDFLTRKTAGRVSGVVDKISFSLRAGVPEPKKPEPPVIRLKFVGDIMLGRTVERKMRANGYASPYVKMADWLRDADITAGNMENAISDRFKNPADPHTMSFVTPGAAAAGLKDAGFDVISLANNHSMNFGTAGLVDSIDILLGNGIIPVGAGRSYADAHTEKIVEAKGTKFAFLGYNTITGGSSATDTKPGLAMIKAAPFFPYSQSDVDVMTADIKRAKSNSDFVTVIFHWGTEYKREPNADQVRIGRAAVDAGADLIVGIHAHVIGTHEIYHDKLITYSLGNFVFDQLQPATKEGNVLEVSVKAGKMVDYKLTRIQIASLYQPYFP